MLSTERSLGRAGAIFVECSAAARGDPRRREGLSFSRPGAVLERRHSLKRFVAPLAALARPSILGGAYLLGLAAYAGFASMRDERVLGVKAGAITGLIAREFQPEIVRLALLLGALALLAGMALGTGAGLLVRLRDRTLDLPACSPRRLALRALGVVAVAHTFLWLHDVARRPQLYEADLYAKGGVRRTLQVAVTDALGTTGVVALAIVALLVFFAGPRSGWPLWPARVERAIARVRRSNAVPVAAALVALALALGGITSIPPAEAAAGDGRMNVLVLAADSLRFDRITARTAPRLAALAASSTTFERAYVSLPRTFPSWVTILTGRHPHHHGIRSMFPRWTARTQDFAPIPRRFAEAGYRTAVVSDYAGDIFRRVDLGFQTTDTPTFNFREIIRQRALAAQTPLLPLLGGRLAQRLVPSLREMSNASDPELVTDDAIRAIDAAKGGPFFLTVFYSTAHFPYAAPAPYYRRFTHGAYRGRFKYDKPNLLGHEAPPDEADVAQIRGLYDGAVASIDAAAGRLLDALARRDLQRRTIVVVTADHGETLYENGHGQGHGDQLFGDEGTHVPLVVHDPRKSAPHAVTTIVRDVDLAPTLCDLAGVEAPHGLDGRSLASALDGRSLPPALAYAETGLWFTETIPEVPAAMRLPYPDVAHLTEVVRDRDDDVEIRAMYEPVAITAKHRMVRDERYKLVYVPARDGVTWLLYDTVEDPGETRDVSAEKPEVVARLRDALFRWMLEDHHMERRDGYLVPRPDAWSRDAEGAPTLRLGDGAAP